MKEQRPPIGIRCPVCGQGNLVTFTRTEEFVFDLGDETVKVRAENVPVEKCDKCEEVMSGPAAAKVRHEAICRAASLLTPSEIKALRDKFDWSQQHLADLTNFGVATVSRWERGRLLQNRSNNKVLQAIRDCPAFREYLERLLASKTRAEEAGPAGGNGAVLPAGHERADERRAPYQMDDSTIQPNHLEGLAKSGRREMVLDPDVAEVFGNPESVNAVLRALIATMPRAALG